MVSERGVRESFGRVRGDIQAVRKSLSDVSQALQSLSSKSSGFTEKKEFYDFIKALESRLAALESSLATKQELQKQGSEHKKEHARYLQSQDKSFALLKSGLADIRKSASGLSKQFSELSRASERLSSVESRMAALSADKDKLQARKEAGKEAAQIKTELSSLRKGASMISGIQENLNELSGQVKSFRAGLARVEAAVLEVPDFSRLMKRLHEIEDRLSDTRKLVKEADVSELKAELSSLTRDFARIDNRFVSWSGLAKHEKSAGQSFESLNAEIRHLRASINEVVKSEVDLGEYVLKGELKESLEGVRKELELLGRSYDKKAQKHEERAQKSEDELREKIRNTASQIEDLSLSLKEVKGRVERASPGFWQRFISPEKEPADKQAQKELKKLRDELDYVKASIVSEGDVNRAVSGVHDEIKELRAKLEKLETRSEEPKLPEYRENEKAGLTNYITALVVIIALVAAGYYAYTQFRPFAEPANITTAPSVITTAVPAVFENATPQNETFIVEEADAEEAESNITAGNVTAGNAAVEEVENVTAENVTVTEPAEPAEPAAANITTANVTPAVAPADNVSSEAKQGLSPKQMKALVDDCTLRFECTTDAEGNYNFDCYYNFNESGCRCFKGEADVCGGERLAMIASLKESKKPVAEIVWKKYRLHIIAVAAIVIFAVLLIYLFRKGEEEAEREETRGKENGKEVKEKKAASKGRRKPGKGL
ncbi:hypothetical protein HYU15_01880 [Candidatus Woesearchaeota archaeon]|nr:hypothetical protein [Candidatus Woesearchaeota archaeon]